MGVEEYAGLMQTGFETKEPVKPENEFFHSCYISGVKRTNESGIEELPNYLQIRGVEYNRDEVYMIITHVKQILCKEKREQNGQTKVECFSYQDGPPPWKGTKHNPCGTNSAERAADPFCSACRAQLLVAGILTDGQGNPVMNEEKKPQFIFIRGKGMKYSGVSNYLGDMSKLEDLDPIFEPVTDESRSFEKNVVNNKRFVTEIKITEVDSNYGPKKVYDLQKGTQLKKETVMEILKITKKTLEKFNDKFDWSKGTTPAAPAANTEGLEPIPDSSTPPAENAKPEEKPAEPAQSNFSFEDMEF